MMNHLQQRYGDEQVLVIPASLVDHLPGGLLPLIDLTNLPYEFIFRYQAEHNPAWRQLIPYIVLKQANRYWLTRRLSTQGEQRLHNRYALGVGGHINPVDKQGTSPIISALYRELEEELDLGGWLPLDPQPQALLNDLTSAVSRDHLGLVFVIEVPKSVTVRVKEREKMVGRWADLVTIRQRFYELLEGWSQLVLRYLEKQERP
ncbi:MAG: NUDIX hydrolase [Firmicutes bacterium]|nr:NUDIX hydrolase [Bacillota bacterium]